MMKKISITTKVSANPHDILDAAKETEDVGIYFFDIDLGTDMKELVL